MNQQATPDNSKIIDRVRKLLNMSKDKADGGEHERDNALRMALKLIAKHNLQPDDYEDMSKREVYKLRIDVCPWRRIICKCVADLFFTSCFAERPGKQTFEVTFVGATGNAITAKEIAHYIILSLQREASKLRKEQFGDAKGYASKWETSFLNGAAYKVAERCRALRAEAEADAMKDSPTRASSNSSSTALTLGGVYASESALNDGYIAQKLNLVITTKSIQTKNMAFDSHGFRTGEVHGETVSLNRQLG